LKYGQIAGGKRIKVLLPILRSGLWGAALTKARQPLVSEWGRSLLAPVVFCGVMVLLYVVWTVGLLR
jgi:hypothetical protein